MKHRIAKKTKHPQRASLIAAYRLGYSSMIEVYSDTLRERRGLSYEEAMQYAAGWHESHCHVDVSFQEWLELTAKSVA